MDKAFCLFVGRYLSACRASQSRLVQFEYVNFYCERFELRRQFISRLSTIFQENVALNRTVVDSD